MAEETNATAQAEAANPAADAATETAEAIETTEAKASAERGADGKFKAKPAEDAPEWRKALGKSAEKYTSEVDVAKALVDAQKLVGKALVPPDAKASDEDKAAFRARLLKEAGIDGVPSKPEEYGLSLAEDAPAEDKDRLARFLDVAHKAGASKSFVEAALAFHAAEVQAQQDAIAAAAADYMAESEVTLRREWRGSEYEVNDAIAEKARQTFVDGDLDIILSVPGTHLAKMLGDKPLKSLPDLKRMFARIGRTTGESRAVIQSSPAGQQTRAQLQKALMDERYLKGDPAFVAETNAAWQRLIGEPA